MQTDKGFRGWKMRYSSKRTSGKRIFDSRAMAQGVVARGPVQHAHFGQYESPGAWSGEPT
jgi:hypothetical protein